MMTILEIRTKIKAIYQRFSMIIDPVFRFIIGLFVFSQINSQVGYDGRFTKTSIVLLLSLVSAIAPWAVMVFLAMALVLVHVYFVSKFIAIFVLIVFIILYCFFLRFAPKMGLAVVAIPILAPFNLHYAVPMYLGMTQNPLSIFASVCGVFLYHMFEVIKAAAEKQISLSFDDVLQLYIDAVDSLVANKAIIATVIVFAIVIVVIFLIRNFSFDFSFEVALGAGMVVNIIGFLVVGLKFDLEIGIGKLILMSLLCAVVVLVMYYMKRILDYTAVERVQFEDDDYYYYVKAVPKIDVPEKTHKVKHINKKDEAPSEAEEEELDIEDFAVRVDERGEEIKTAEDAYLKGVENFEDFEVDLTMDDDKNNRF